MQEKSGKETTLLHNDKKQELQKEWFEQAHYYQPAYRYEDPFWKNSSFKHSFKNERIYRGEYGKELEIITSLKKNYSYIMDMVLDNLLYSSEVNKELWNTINKILREIKQDENICFGIGPRNFNNRIGIYKSDEILLNNIDQLSLGELVLLNLCINIVRHTDLSNKPINGFKGVVVIDEIDAHLHSNLQSDVLPKLIKLFPKIQFILTTHSPLFVLGMQKEFSDDGFDLFEMPKGKKISAERFSEFQKAYKDFTKTKTFEEEIKTEIANSKLPLVFVEGDYDIRYIKHICRLFQREDILNKIKLCSVGGYKELNKIWNNKEILKYFDKKILLLYDCDTLIKDENDGYIVKRLIPQLENGLFDRGIENRFSRETIEKIEREQCKCIDFVHSHVICKGGEKITIPKTYSINRDKKGDLCDWICQNGIEEDFENFKIILEIIDEFLEQ
ncbi:AAA family ATPase [Helicobacter pullorum]|uniref:AAA family ATPase n=1 Tax=Helicobacter pullorum TaxID=35818 RepID=UPI003B96F3CE